jgi:phospholipid/cholesterol/gamma-HCH transport system ATP-binding protein
MPEPIIQLREVYRHFGSLKVLDGVNLDIYPGEVTVILGKSGVGKSVLLKHIIGLLEPDSGQVLIYGRDIWKVSKDERRRLLAKLGYMFQATALFDSFTVYENITLPLAEKGGMGDKDIHERFNYVMNLMDLGDIETKYPAQISGGMRKRVALARSLITEPEVLLFDEPTTGLDPVRKMGVLRMVSDYHNKLGFTGVLVSHAIPEMLYISQKVAFLDNGKIIFFGQPEELLHSDDPVVSEFFVGVDTKTVDLEAGRRIVEQDVDTAGALS